MLGSTASLPNVRQRSCPAQVREWLKKRQNNQAPFSELIAIEAGRLVIYPAAKSNWLVCLEWSADFITVKEPQTVAFPYEFRAFESALTFIDALLLHYFSNPSEPHLKNPTVSGLADVFAG